MLQVCLPDSLLFASPVVLWDKPEASLMQVPRSGLAGAWVCVWGTYLAKDMLFPKGVCFSFCSHQWVRFFLFSSFPHLVCQLSPRSLYTWLPLHEMFFPVCPSPGCSSTEPLALSLKVTFSEHCSHHMPPGPKFVSSRRAGPMCAGSPWHPGGSSTVPGTEEELNT